tara:strand:+ start:333 stop:605 length:273 start_codon:yes stop_codon:yes gene_type:complete
MSKLEKLVNQKKILESRIRKQKALEANRKRKALTKTKILLGAYTLNCLQNSSLKEVEIFEKKIEPFLTREKEKALVQEHIKDLIEKIKDS